MTRKRWNSELLENLELPENSVPGYLGTSPQNPKIPKCFHPFFPVFLELPSILELLITELLICETLIPETLIHSLLTHLPLTHFSLIHSLLIHSLFTPSLLGVYNNVMALTLPDFSLLCKPDSLTLSARYAII